MLTGHPLEILHRLMVNAYNADVYWLHPSNTIYYNNNSADNDYLLLDDCEYRFVYFDNVDKIFILAKVREILSKDYSNKPCYCKPVFIYNRNFLMVRNMYVKKLNDYENFYSYVRFYKSEFCNDNSDNLASALVFYWYYLKEISEKGELSNILDDYIYFDFIPYRLT